MAKKDTNEEQDIQVGDPQSLRPVDLPLVVILPDDASKAQIAYAKVLNVYAYKNPTKWAIKKDVLIQTLRSLKDAPDPIENPDASLTLNKNIIS
jgi:hypothetical protein